MITENDIRLAKEYNSQALTRVCEHYYPAIYRYLYMKVSNAEDAEDLTQEVFIKMAKNINNLSGRLDHWLFTIAKNITTDFYRKKAVQKKSFELLKNEPLNSPAQETSTLTLDYLKEKIDCLPNEQKEVVLLKFVNELTNKQVASIMHKTEGAIKALQFRAIQGLKKLITVRDIS